jgi:hypothetical protein
LSVAEQTHPRHRSVWRPSAGVARRSTASLQTAWIGCQRFAEGSSSSNRGLAAPQLPSRRPAHRGPTSTERNHDETTSRGIGNDRVGVRRAGLGRSGRRYRPGVQWRLGSVRLRPKSVVPRGFLVYGSGWAVPGCRVGHECLPHLVPGGPGRGQCSRRPEQRQ